MRNLPLFIFKDVDKSVASLHFGTIIAHCEFVDADILSPICASYDVPGEDHTLGLLFEEVVEVVNYELFGVSWDVRDSGLQYSFFAISSSNSC